MPTYPTGLGRIGIPYTTIVSSVGLNHVAHAYCRNPQVGGDSYQINSRLLDENDLNWEDAAQGFADLLSFFLDDTAQLGDAVLEKFDGSVWNTLDVETVTNSLGAGATYPASQDTIVLRDTALKKLKIVILEGNTQPLYHTKSFTTFDSGYGAAHDRIDPETANGGDFAVWAVSHRGLYLNTAPFVGFTVATNRKVRRRRGLA